MKKYSWYTISVKLTDLSTVYQYAVDRYIPLEVDRHGFGSYIHVKAETFVTRHDGGWRHYKPNRKGGHTHNHIRNAHKRMRKCHICGEPIVRGCQVSDGWNEFQCRSCRTEECREEACLIGVSFGGCYYKTRRK